MSDFSIIRFSTRGEASDRAALMEWVRAECAIRIYLGWSYCCSVWWNVAYVLNHEVIHGVIERIAADDKIHGESKHWPFFAGIDTLFDYSYSFGHLQELLPPLVFEHEVLAFGHPHFRRYWLHRWEES